KLRELIVSYRVGPINGVGDWDVSFIGRNLFTITGYRGFDPEVGIAGGDAGSAAVNAVDAFTFPNLRTFSFAVSTKFYPEAWRDDHAQRIRGTVRRAAHLPRGVQGAAR